MTDERNSSEEIPDMTINEDSRKLILQMGISLDGFVAVPSENGLTPVMEGGSGLPPEDPELTRTKVAWAWEAGAHVMGRVTYEEMASYWPSSTHDYAAPMNEIPKVVFSKSIERADWPESQIARGDLAEEIAILKGSAGKDIIAWGGAAFAQSLARLGLIDEYRLVTHPVAVAKGEPLFKDLSSPARLRLVETRTFTSAAVHVYEPA
jgi:dihydrofolate reductase